ncbi:MAG: hypothetical protein KAU95_00365, partial [Candidatus Aenigmarchaeota archaeon]|nr:hypothetical protein [Candidatus Aenigmarchaeota archaeon]
PSSGARRNFEAGLNSALENEVSVFGFSGIACGVVYYIPNCYTVHIPNSYCSCSKSVLRSWMNEISNETGGKMYSLENASYAVSAIEEIITKAKTVRIPHIEAGTMIPMFKDTRAVTIWIPITALGEHVELKVYYWS